MKSDPPYPADGMCVTCGHREAHPEDPFCSAECCRWWHGCPITGDPEDPAAPRVNRRTKVEA